MPAEVLALITSFFFAAQTVCARLGLRSSSTLTGVFISLVVAVVGLWGSALLLGQFQYSGLRATALFTLSGFLSPALSWYLFFEGITRIGLARTAPLAAVAPFFAALAGILFFGEPFNASIAIGIVAVVGGVVFISFRREEGEWRRFDIIYPLASAVCFAGAMVIRKAALMSGGTSMMAGAISASGGLVFLCFLLAVSRSLGPWKYARSDLPYLVLAGIMITIAYGAYFSALRHGNLIMVSPVVNTNPLFSLILGGIFLRQYERFTPTVITGAVCIVFGVLLLTLFS